MPISVADPAAFVAVGDHVEVFVIQSASGSGYIAARDIVVLGMGAQTSGATRNLIVGLPQAEVSRLIPIFDGDLPAGATYHVGVVSHG
jgi:hypothetical protein